MDFSSETRIIVNDYLNYKTQKRSIPSESPNKIQSVLRDLGNKFEITDLNVPSDPSAARDTFLVAADELFIDEIHWGRVSALVALGGIMAARAENLVPWIHDWVSTYINDRLKSWILTRGGWNGLIEFYEKKTTARSSLRRIFFADIGRKLAEIFIREIINIIM